MVPEDDNHLLLSPPFRTVFTTHAEVEMPESVGGKKGEKERRCSPKTDDDGGRELDGGRKEGMSPILFSSPFPPVFFRASTVDPC